MPGLARSSRPLTYSVPSPTAPPACIFEVVGTFLLYFLIRSAERTMLGTHLLAYHAFRYAVDESGRKVLAKEGPDRGHADNQGPGRVHQAQNVPNLVFYTLLGRIGANLCSPFGRVGTRVRHQVEEPNRAGQFARSHAFV